MSRKSIESESKAFFLRRNAESRLKTGSAPRTRGVPLDREALSLLYDMAGDPERSSDALRLLHELQVHQVELDLQRDELENREHELTRELAVYKTLVELTPAPCLVMTLEGRIIDANPAVTTLLSIGRDELAGRALRDFMKQESHGTLAELLRQLRAGEHAASCEVLVGIDDGEPVRLRLSESVLAEGDTLLLGVVSPESVLHDLSKSD